jgi:hypothetical protein
MNYEAMILDLAVDDFVGLWELLWRANTVAPAIEETVRRTEVQKALAALLEREAVSLFEGSRFAGEECQIPRERALRLINEPVTWDAVGPGEHHIRAGATVSGEEEYRQSQGK